MPGTPPRRLLPVLAAALALGTTARATRRVRPPTPPPTRRPPPATPPRSASPTASASRSPPASTAAATAAPSVALPRSRRPKPAIGCSTSSTATTTSPRPPRRCAPASTRRTSWWWQLAYPDDPAWIDAAIAAHQPLPPWSQGTPKAMTADSLERVYDLTLPAAPAVLAAEAVPAPYKPTEIGGLDAFLQTISATSNPASPPSPPSTRPTRPCSATPSAAWPSCTPCTKPVAFGRFIAASPSIWWGDRAVLKDEPAFEEKVHRGEAAARVLITVGAEEETLKLEPGAFPAEDMARLREMVRRQRMVGEARTWPRGCTGCAGSQGEEPRGCGGVRRHRPRAVAVAGAGAGGEYILGRVRKGCVCRRDGGIER